MKRSLPPLQALRAFEAAGRHLSFTLAARELCVTQGAVSRHVKRLEAHLGQPLFKRMTRRVELTAFGRSYLEAADSSFRLLEEADRRRPRTRPTLQMSATQSFANLWLLPRLSAFAERQRDFEIQVDTSTRPVDFEKDDVDVAIRLGRLPGSYYRADQPELPHRMLVDWTGIIAEHLLDEVLVPVASPQVLARHRVRRPKDLLAFELLHVTYRPTAWTDWFRAHGVTAGTLEGPEYGHFFLALEAAKKKGVAIVPTVLLEGFPGRDELECPIPSRIKSAGAYYLLYRERHRTDPRIRQLREWLLAQARRQSPS